ncbi:MAG: hypothetical protein J4G05_06660, partial [Chlorobi bacterium]|nr:hypothetical protein [Chlorobiota bacterium]
MRRRYLRGQEKISRRLCIHVGAFNLGLVMRKITGAGTPRCLEGLLSFFFAFTKELKSALDLFSKVLGAFGRFPCK